MATAQVPPAEPQNPKSTYARNLRREEARKNAALRDENGNIAPGLVDLTSSIAPLTASQLLATDGSGKIVTLTSSSDPVFTANVQGNTFNNVGLTSPVPGHTATLTIANDATLATSGDGFVLTLTATADSTPTFPSGTTTLVDTNVTDLSSLEKVGTLITGIWNATKIDHNYLSPENAASTGASGAITTTETLITKTAALAANRLLQGTTLRIIFIGTATASSTGNKPTFNVRIGTNGTISDGLMLSCQGATSPGSGTTIPFRTEINLVVRTTGASATCYGFCTICNQGTTGIQATATQILIGSATNFNTTTANNIIDACVLGGANLSITIQHASIEFVNL